MTDVSQPPRARRVPRAERREEILAAATRVFGSKGFRAGSLAEVADQVGITHAGVLHHFGSKDKLLWEVLEYRDRVDVEHLEGQHIPGGTDLFRHLVKTAGLNADRRGIVQAYTVLTGEAVTDGHPAAERVRTRFETLRAEIAAAVREVAVERGATVSAVDSERAASAVIGVMDGLQTQWLLDPTVVSLPESTAFAIEAILSAVVKGVDHLPPPAPGPEAAPAPGDAA